MPPTSTVEAAATGSTNAQPKGKSRLRKLTDEQEREVAHLYAETDTPVLQIASRFGIAESSVYRVSQRHGAVLRARTTTGSSTAQASGTQATSTRPAARQRRTTGGASPAQGRTRRSSLPALEQPAPKDRPAGSSAAPAASQATARPSNSGAPRRFRILFVADKVIEAESMRDVIGKAEALGAIDITSITRED
jgi:transposase-like protein